MANFEYSEEKKRKDAALAQHNTTKPGAFSYSGAAAMDNLANQLQNYKKFSYDINADALYQQYKDQYIQQGNLAKMDTMGQAAAMTGGYGNSYAQNVGQQAYQGYLQQLNNEIPELYQLALNQYTQDKQDLYNQYALHQDKKNQEYTEYLNNFNNWLSDRDYLANDVANTAQTEYNQWLDSKEMEENEKANLINLITSTGYNPTDAELKAAGMTRGQADSYATAYTTSTAKAAETDKKNTMPLAEQLRYEEAAKTAMEEKGVEGLYKVGERMENEGYSDAFITKWIMSQLDAFYGSKEQNDEKISAHILSIGGGASGTYYAKPW